MFWQDTTFLERNEFALEKVQCSIAKTFYFLDMIRKRKDYQFTRNCVVPENIHTPPTEGIGNSGEEGGSQRPKNLKECMKLNWNFWRGGVGGGGQRANPFHGGVWIFSGTKQFTADILNKTSSHLTLLS